MKIRIYETLKNMFTRNREIKQGNIDHETAKRILKNDKDAVLVDVRSPQEYKEKHLDGSINIPVYEIEQKSKEIIPNKNNVYILYCQSGGRSSKAVKILEKQGYSKLYNIEGGLDNI